MAALTPLQSFMRWWNSSVQENGKLKFSNQREAAEFVRRAQNQTGGPNTRVLEMRKKYNEVNRAKESRKDSAGPNKGRGAPVYR